LKKNSALCADQVKGHAGDLLVERVRAERETALELMDEYLKAGVSENSTFSIGAVFAQQTYSGYSR